MAREDRQFRFREMKKGIGENIKVNITIVKKGVDEVDIADGNYDLMVVNRGRLNVLVVLVPKDISLQGDYVGRVC